MKKIKSGHIVSGVIGGHPFVNTKNHASSGAAVVRIPAIQTNIAKMTNRSSNAAKSAIKAANTKGAV